jgi:hypothetical protein
MPGGDWRSLFNGHTLTGWAPTGRPEGWSVQDGCIVCTGRGGGYLRTLEQFADFELTLEFRIDPGVQSGILFRWSDLQDPANTALEMPILDTHGREPPGPRDCGALDDMVAPRVQAVRPGGTWNGVLIRCAGPLVDIELNGVHVVAADVSLWTEPHRNPDGTPNRFAHAWARLPQRGHIGLEDHGGRVWFRNVRLRELPQP